MVFINKLGNQCKFLLRTFIISQDWQGYKLFCHNGSRTRKVKVHDSVLIKSLMVTIIGCGQICLTFVLVLCGFWMKGMGKLKSKFGNKIVLENNVIPKKFTVFHLSHCFAVMLIWMALIIQMINFTTSSLVWKATLFLELFPGSLKLFCPLLLFFHNLLILHFVMGCYFVETFHTDGYWL